MRVHQGIDLCRPNQTLLRIVFSFFANLRLVSKSNISKQSPVNRVRFANVNINSSQD